MPGLNRKFLRLRSAATRFWVVMSILMVSAGPASGKKPDKPGSQGKHKEDSHHHESTSYGYFTPERTTQIRTYYTDSKVKGHCPPGLAKKNNGCQPPGQAKQWQKGQPLPREVVYEELPPGLLDELGQTPEGQKLVRVGTDILLISVGTGMVLDAIKDLDDVF